MKKIITNKYKLKEEDVNELVKRVKLLILNSKNEILMAYSNNTYQFPGGHVEEGETLVQALNREIAEETGIDLNLNEKTKAFACALSYFKDYPQKGTNRKIEIYYYEIKTDVLPDLSKTKYTDNEKLGNFSLKYIKLDNLLNTIKENTSKYGDEMGIAKEIFNLFKIYKK